MTNTQLWLAIEIPSVLVILSWLTNNSRLASLEARMESRFNRLEDRTDKRFDAVDRRLEGVDRRFDDLIGKIVGLHKRVAVVEAKQQNP